MKRIETIISKTVLLFVVLFALVTAGCAYQKGTTTKQYDENWRFVPRIHVENDSFGTTSSEYRGCSYDQLYEGYWCPAK